MAFRRIAFEMAEKSTPIMDPTTRNLRDLPRIDRLNGRTR